MTRRVRFYEYGGPEVLRFVDEEVGQPGGGEVRLQVRAIGLNRAEAAFRQGHYVEKARLPATLGYEAAGVIEAVGPGVEGFAAGDLVSVIPSFSMNRYGVYAREAIVPASSLIPVPASLTAEEAASIWMANLTAYGALVDICRLGPDEPVVITAASSSVGLAAIDIARRVGAIPIAVTRSPAKQPLLERAGAAHVFVPGDRGIAARVREITGGSGARVGLDPVGGPIVGQLAEALAPGGTLVLYGNLSGEMRNTPIPFGAMAGGGLSLRGYLVFEVLHDAARFDAARRFVLDGLQSGALSPHIDRVFDFDDLVAAHRYLEAGGQVGKIVVTTGE